MKRKSNESHLFEINRITIILRSINNSPSKWRILMSESHPKTQSAFCSHMEIAMADMIFDLCPFPLHSKLYPQHQILQNKTISSPYKSINTPCT